jgi:hypothetical protein
LQRFPVLRNGTWLHPEQLHRTFVA